MSGEAAPKQMGGGYPIAHPPAAGKKPPLTSINRQIGSGNDGAHTGTTRSRDIEALASQLSERDWAILRSVAEHQFLTVRQVEVLHFARNAPTSGSRIARRTLARLRRLRLLAALERRTGGLGAGSEGLVHYVDVVGDRLLRGRSGRRARRFHEPSRRFVRHRLAIADARLALIEADHRHQLELVESAVEPTSWRRFTGIGGARLTLKPDLYVETAADRDGDLVSAWFLEIDLGTEHIPTLLKKCHDYEAYRRTGIEQDRHGAFPLVVWSVTHTDEARATPRRLALQDAIDADRSLTSKLFRVVAPDLLVSLLANGGAE